MVGKSPFKAGVEALPAALAAVDQHGVVQRLARLHLLPTCAQCVEHMLCEWRKMCLPEGRTARATLLKTTKSCGWQWHPSLHDVPPPASE